MGARFRAKGGKGGVDPWDPDRTMPVHGDLEIATDRRSAGVTIAREQALDTIVAMVMSSLPEEY